MDFWVGKSVLGNDELTSAHLLDTLKHGMVIKWSFKVDWNGKGEDNVYSTVKECLCYVNEV